MRTPRARLGVHSRQAEIDLAGQVGDAQHILIRLGGQAQHKVQLDPAPAAGKSCSDGLHQVLLPQVLIDGVPQALGARLRGEGQAALAHPLQPLHQPHGEGVRPKGGQGQADVPGLAVVQQVVAQIH